MPTILIADDSMFQRFQTAKMAAQFGYEVLEAKDGEECLRVVLEKRPEVLLLDLNMPVLDGLAVLERLGAAGAMPPWVFVITADIQDTTRKRCLELGARDCINKPVDQAVLERCLAEAGTRLG
ncbi:response regulator [Desulfolutivibrio sulfoxidireducens]|uniref:response regulator n=1 Tax=Desulfolutivibrio sulfoxidireducens TaxID=2773299 RepID=UPI00159DB24E|nr:response regulator [Desulfolutivibrio sulfoxidireducens]QLA17823.1 response regulator [Desulfolutivibrio sulfoxidireducens]QLA21401.1 response regulator [Desulfolutivibrio sulfoxidireducens]